MTPGQERTEVPTEGPQRASHGRAPAGIAPKRSLAYPKAVDRLIAEFANLPGIGRRTAERLAFFILKSGEPEALALAQAVIDVKKTVRHCEVCFNLSDQTLCDICSDGSRDRRTVLVVEQPKDLIALEQTSMYRGLYHVLMGRLSPLEGVGPDELTISRLLERIDQPERNPGGVPVGELILGLNPTIEGDGTGLYLAEQARARAIKVTRLARGLPSGSQLEYANKAVLTDAIQGRQSMG
jgi:recombination protein RecR